MQYPIWRTKQSRERQARFKHVMQLAREITQIDPYGLSTLVRVVLAPLQARAITSAANNAPHKARAPYEFNALFFNESLPITKIGQNSYELIPTQKDKRYSLRLGTDPLLPVPWHRGRLASALATIGFAKSQGKWESDPNHQVTLLLPCGIGLVSGGNHSIAAGIANGEGRVETAYTMNLAPLYEHVSYNGLAFVRSHDGAVLSRPANEEAGIVFEIGRLMHDYGIHYDAECINSDAQPLPCHGDEDGYYKVLLDGKDAGVAMTLSGAAHVLRQAGIQQGSAEWDSMLRGQLALKRTHDNGHQEDIHFCWSMRRQVVNDLRHVYGPASWAGYMDE